MILVIVAAVLALVAMSRMGHFAQNVARAVKNQKRSRRWSVIGRDRGGDARFNGTSWRGET